MWWEKGSNDEVCYGQQKNDQQDNLYLRGGRVEMVKEREGREERTGWQEEGEERKYGHEREVEGKEKG